ncbi:MAG: hypothetical protein ACE144_07595 [Thermodesulfobacteriota bacterium]
MTLLDTLAVTHQSKAEGLTLLRSAAIFQFDDTGKGGSERCRRKTRLI